MDSTDENRKYQRHLVSQQLDCKVRLIKPQSQLLRLSDISAGGMMVLLSSKEDLGKFLPPQEILGEIVSDNTALQMEFSGKVAWKREFQEGRQTFESMGIQFAPGVKLPEAITEMLTAEDE